MRVGSAWKSQDTNSFSPAAISMKSSRSTRFQSVTSAIFRTATRSTSVSAVNSRSIFGPELDRYYGSGPGYGFEIFLRIRPSRHDHSGMQMDEPSHSMP